MLEGRVLLVSLPVSFLAKGVSDCCERPALDKYFTVPASYHRGVK